VQHNACRCSGEDQPPPAHRHPAGRPWVCATTVAPRALPSAMRLTRPDAASVRSGPPVPGRVKGSCHHAPPLSGVGRWRGTAQAALGISFPSHDEVEKSAIGYYIASLHNYCGWRKERKRDPHWLVRTTLC
jgi:hypothetical protein